MGTRSRIGVMHGDIVKSVYCHWDGYLSHNGTILQKHYDSSKANQLVALGDISSLGKDIGEKHAFDTYHLSPEDRKQHELDHGDSTTFYGRDREEVNVSWQVSHTFLDFLSLVEGCGAEYYYIMRDGEWYCGSPYKGSKLVRLAEALEAVAETA
jgi:hypothetical protein